MPARTEITTRRRSRLFLLSSQIWMERHHGGLNRPNYRRIALILEVDEGVMQNRSREGERLATSDNRRRSTNEISQVKKKGGGMISRVKSPASHRNGRGLALDLVGDRWQLRQSIFWIGPNSDQTRTCHRQHKIPYGLCRRAINVDV